MSTEYFAANIICLGFDLEREWKTNASQAPGKQPLGLIFFLITIKRVVRMCTLTSKWVEE